MFVACHGMCHDAQQPDVPQASLHTSKVHFFACRTFQTFLAGPNTLPQVIHSLRSVTSHTNSPLLFRMQTSDNSPIFNIKETNPTAPPVLLRAADLIN